MKKQQGFIVLVPFGFVVFLAIMFFGALGYAKLSTSAEKEDYIENRFPSELVGSYTNGTVLSLSGPSIIDAYDRDDVMELLSDFCTEEDAGIATGFNMVTSSHINDTTAATEYRITCTMRYAAVSFFELMMLIDGDRIEEFMDDNDIDMESLKKYEAPKPVVEEVKEVAPVIMQPVQPVQVQTVEPALDVAKTPITVQELMAMEEWFGGYLYERCNNVFFNGATYELVPGSPEINVEFYEDSRDYYTLVCSNPQFRQKSTGKIEKSFETREFKLDRMKLRRVTQ